MDGNLQLIQKKNDCWCIVIDVYHKVYNVRISTAPKMHSFASILAHEIMHIQGLGYRLASSVEAYRQWPWPCYDNESEAQIEAPRLAQEIYDTLWEQNLREAGHKQDNIYTPEEKEFPDFPGLPE